MFVTSSVLNRWSGGGRRMWAFQSLAGQHETVLLKMLTPLRLKNSRVSSVRPILILSNVLKSYQVEKYVAISRWWHSWLPPSYLIISLCWLLRLRRHLNFDCPTLVSLAQAERCGSEIRWIIVNVLGPRHCMERIWKNMKGVESR